ncbi:hypothetical protein [Lichenifustis flavocetrariae]|uniref:VPLPA-CTERM sorting domain-containing protein n=1 Tax=Lichenifustis flavocetrariae TaxID=2949735 RepID=A0AA41Z3J8_9HYPH|nr:hypothetical protein [Lichenifustis flavocetrariae]MCW6509700.1 hypothetical protein [Lichenifustis flavocetrariae]
MRRKSLITTGLAGLLLLGVGSAQAGVIFTDNFNNETPGTPSTLTNFNITAGSIDVIPSGGNFDFYPGNGLYVDLDGTNTPGSPASTISSKMLFNPGTYTVMFNLGGNDRGDGDKTTTVSLGGTTQSYTLASNAGFLTESFTAMVSGSASALSFTEVGSSDNIGNILDNVSVSVSSVPLPASAPMFGAALLALAGFGYAAKRKQAATAA